MLDGQSGLNFPKHCSRTHNWGLHYGRRVIFIKEFLQKFSLNIFFKDFHQRSSNKFITRLLEAFICHTDCSYYNTFIMAHLYQKLWLEYQILHVFLLPFTLSFFRTPTAIAPGCDVAKIYEKVSHYFLFLTFQIPNV